MRTSTQNSQTRRWEREKGGKKSEFNLSNSQSAGALSGLLHEKVYFCVCVGPHTSGAYTPSLSLHVTLLANQCVISLELPLRFPPSALLECSKEPILTYAMGSVSNRGRKPAGKRRGRFGGRKAAVCLVFVIRSTYVNLCNTSTRTKEPSWFRINQCCGVC